MYFTKNVYIPPFFGSQEINEINSGVWRQIDGPELTKLDCKLIDRQTGV